MIFFTPSPSSPPIKGGEVFRYLAACCGVVHSNRFLDGKKYELYAAVVLNDHVHIIINPTNTLSKIMHSIKSFTAHEINKIAKRKGKLWQDESFDRVIRNEGEFLEKVNYIANNPLKVNLAERYEDYKWLYIKGWIGNDS